MPFIQGCKNSSMLHTDRGLMLLLNGQKKQEEEMIITLK